MAQNDFSLQVNVAGEQLFKPGTFDVITDGPHEATIVGASREASKGKNEDGSPKPDNIVVEVEVAKGADKGKKCKVFLSAVKPEPGTIQAKHWKNLLVSIAKDPAQLEKGEITITQKTLAPGKTVYIFVKNPAEGEKNAQGKKPFANVNFITKDMVAELAAKPGAAKPSSAGNGAAKSFEVEGGGDAPAPAADALE